MNNKIDIIARRILGWKLNRWDRWYDHENGIFIHESEFQPEQELDHAMKIVEKLEKFGYKYTAKDEKNVCFNRVCGTGETLAIAITNAAFELADNPAIDPGWL